MLHLISTQASFWCRYSLGLTWIRCTHSSRYAAVSLFLAGLSSSLLQAFCYWITEKMSILSGKHGINLLYSPLVSKSACTGNWACRTVWFVGPAWLWERRLLMSHAKFCCHQSVHQPVGWLDLLSQIFFVLLPLSHFENLWSVFLSHTADWEIYLVFCEGWCESVSCRKAGSWNGVEECRRPCVTWARESGARHGVDL